MDDVSMSVTELAPGENALRPNDRGRARPHEAGDQLGAATGLLTGTESASCAARVNVDRSVSTALSASVTVTADS